MRIAVARERAAGETRVALTPEVVARLVRAGHAVTIERGAGDPAGFPDAAYEAAKATLAADAAAALEGAELVARVAPPAAEDARLLPVGAVLVGFLFPHQNLASVRVLLERKVTAFAIDLVPRITRAQAMDGLSSMSTVAGYRAALLAAEHLPRFFPMLMTAAGTVAPARVVVLGCGVAGLQAIATCRRLGAVVEATDIREEAQEQAKSLGASVITADLGEEGHGEGGYARMLSEAAQRKQREALAERIRQCDALITTALVPGKPAPRLVTADTVSRMKPGSVVVDLAAESGGNVEGSEPGRVVRKGGVTIVGPANLPASMAGDASRMFARNVEEVVKHLTPKAPKDGPPPTERVRIDLSDEIDDAAIALHAGEARHALTRERLANGGGAR